MNSFERLYKCIFKYIYFQDDDNDCGMRHEERRFETPAPHPVRTGPSPHCSPDDWTVRDFDDASPCVHLFPQHLQGHIVPILCCIRSRQHRRRWVDGDFYGILPTGSILTIHKLLLNHWLCSNVKDWFDLPTNWFFIVRCLRQGVQERPGRSHPLRLGPSQDSRQGTEGGCHKLPEGLQRPRNLVSIVRPSMHGFPRGCKRSRLRHWRSRRMWTVNVCRN